MCMPNRPITRTTGRVTIRSVHPMTSLRSSAIRTASRAVITPSTSSKSRSVTGATTHKTSSIDVGQIAGRASREDPRDLAALGDRRPNVRIDDARSYEKTIGMNNARAEILGRVRRALKRGALAPADAAGIEARVAAHAPGPIPARTQLDRESLIALFSTKLQGVAGTVERLGAMGDVPGAVARYLARHNLPAAIKLAPAPMLAQIDWTKEPLLQLSAGA